MARADLPQAQGIDNTCLTRRTIALGCIGAHVQLAIESSRRSDFLHLHQLSNRRLFKTMTRRGGFPVGLGESRHNIECRYYQPTIQEQFVQSAEELA